MSRYPWAALGNREPTRIRIAAAGDIHCAEEERSRLQAAFAEADRHADLILLAGDLTTYGEPEQAAVLADVARNVETPILAVLGNHDWHADRRDELVEVLQGGNVRVLERDATTVEVRGATVGIVGTKGFIGGFPDAHLPDFGEPMLRRIYAETSAEVEAIDRGLRGVTGADLKLVLLHYSPSTTTLEGEPETIWALLGSDRLARPIVTHRPDAVFHGHGHGGTFSGSIHGVPVFNVGVAVPVQSFWLFEFDPDRGLVSRPDAAAAERA